MRKGLIVSLVVLFVLSYGLVSPAADFNGDGTNDIGIFRPGAGLWAIRGVTRVYFGSSDDNPMPGDYNGDGTVDIALFRPSSGLWAVRGVTRVYFGGSGDDPLPGIPAGGGASQQALPKTGQTTSYRTGDDGDLEIGLALLDNSDVVVTDSRTGLMWPKHASQDGYWNNQSATWNEAIDWAYSLNFAGYTDWRLPNINELKSFQEVTWGHYNGQQPHQYWSSTTSKENSSYALYVMFHDGAVDAIDKSNSFFVVAVRGGE